MSAHAVRLSTPNIPDAWREPIQDHRFVRIEELMYRLGRSREHIRRLRIRGLIPEPKQISSRDVFWIGKDIKQLFEGGAQLSGSA